MCVQFESGRWETRSEGKQATGNLAIQGEGVRISKESYWAEDRIWHIVNTNPDGVSILRV